MGGSHVRFPRVGRVWYFVILVWYFVIFVWCFIIFVCLFCHLCLVFHHLCLFCHLCLVFHHLCLFCHLCLGFIIFVCLFLSSLFIQSESLQREITDLQSEFEFDRIDYLNTIRRQEEQILWFQAVVDRIHPLVRSGCNYGNLDRIRSLSKWDETNRQWTLPKVTMEDVQLPVSGGGKETSISSILGIDCFEQADLLDA